MDFVTKSFRKDETLTSWTLLQHTWLLNTIAVKPKKRGKNGCKSVQLVRVSSFRNDLLQNAYFKHCHDWKKSGVGGFSKILRNFQSGSWQMICYKVGGWGEKRPKICLRNTWMVPYAALTMLIFFIFDDDRLIKS